MIAVRHSRFKTKPKVRRQLPNSFNALRALKQFKYNVDGYLIALECFNGKEYFEVHKRGHLKWIELCCCVCISHDQQQQRESTVCEGIDLRKCVMGEVFHCFQKK